jgi:hypothetical protein
MTIHNQFKILTMKKNIIILCAVLFIISCAFAAGKNIMSGIHGTVNPADGAAKIWAVSGKDSVAATLSSGSFTIDVKPGTWRLYVTAIKGYKSTAVENIIVDTDRYTDVGEIKLATE